MAAVHSHLTTLNTETLTYDSFKTAKPSVEQDTTVPFDDVAVWDEGNENSDVQPLLPAGSELATLPPSPDLVLSTPAEMRLPLLWIAVLHGHIPVSLAASTGVESADDVFKYLLAGADTVMTTASLLRRGAGHMRTLLDGLVALLAARGIDSRGAIRGRMSQRTLGNPVGFERAAYTRMLQGYPVPHDA